MHAPHTWFQTGDTAFAAACASLGLPYARNTQKHVKLKSSTHISSLSTTWYLGRTATEEASELLTKASKGELPAAHPLFFCRAAIENFQALKSPPAIGLSLLPADKNAFLTGENRTCILRPRRQNDNDLNSPPLAPLYSMQPLPAAVLATCGFALRLTPDINGGFPCDRRPSMTFPGLTIDSMALAFGCYRDETNIPPSELAPGVQLTHTLPGFPAGEHPAHYALAALHFFERFTSPAARVPTNILFQHNFAALLPRHIDKATEELTDKFCAEGGRVFLNL